MNLTIEQKEQIADFVIKEGMIDPADFFTEYNTLEIVKAEVCKYYNVSARLLRIKNRTREVTKVRHVFIYIACRYGYSTTKVGLNILRDHSTVTHGRDKIAEMIEEDKPWYDKHLAKDVKIITDRVEMIISEK
jgi:chromosomal replication initiator protein